MNNSIERHRYSSARIESVVGWLAFILLIVVLGLLAYYDDLQITDYSWQEVPTIYNMRILGLKIIDILSIALVVFLFWYLLLKGKVTVTPYHKYLFIITAVYCYACFVGYIYSFFLHYNYLYIIQDFQQVIYLVGFFLLTFYFLDSKLKWTIFVSLFLIFLSAKNAIILYNSFMGIGKAFGDWAFRASQNSEWAYFPMMFFPLLVVFIKSKSFLLRMIVGIALFIYSYNSLISIVRTVWVMLILGTLILMYYLDTQGRKRIIVYGLLSFGTALGIIAILYPHFLSLAWNYKFASIFDWSVHGDRSNATRIIELTNVMDYVFKHFAFLQGMGLGSMWDDSLLRLLPDLGSGFTYQTRFRVTHMFYLTQFMKLGIIGVIIFWNSIYKIYKNVFRSVHAMSWNRWEKPLLAGLLVGYVCAFLSSADYVRLFTFIGINIGMMASFFSLDEETKRAIS